MGRVLRGVGMLMLALVAGAFLIGVVARLGDGPVGPFPGGALRKGDLHHGEEPDWSFARDLSTMELQTETPARSRTTWLLVVGDQIYVPCGLPEVKSWDDDVARDGRVIVRVNGVRYLRTARRVTDPDLLRRLGDETRRKYTVEGDPTDASRVIFFRLEERTDA
jgi:hypothetical protein